jgi:ATP-binding cassette subfamily F protein uup
MESAIEAAETRKAELEAQLVDPSVYSSASKAAEVQKELGVTAAEVERLYARWQELQNLAAGS